MIERGDLVEIAPVRTLGMLKWSTSDTNVRDFQTSYGVISKTYTFWRPPAGHEDIQTEPGTMPGTYGSPANPPAGFGNLLTSPPGFAAKYHMDSLEGKTPTAGRDWLALTESTPRMQNMTLDEIQTASLKSPRWGNAPHLPDEASKRGYEEEDIGDPYEDREGESGNTCQWEKAKSPILSDVKEQAPGRYSDKKYTC
jgi:hypothetical protein